MVGGNWQFSAGWCISGEGGGAGGGGWAGY